MKSISIQKKFATAAIAATSVFLLTACVSVNTTSGRNKTTNNNAQTETRTTAADIHPWKNKKVAYFGDSVTDPNVLPDDTKYWGYLRDRLGITPYVYGVNGMQWSDIPRQTDELIKQHGQDVDAIMIFIGTNDFNGGVPIGSFYTESKETVVAATGEPRSEKTRMHRTVVKDPSTLCGRINIALEKIKATYPTKQVILLTPIHRAYAEFGDNNVQPDENWQNNIGEWFTTYVETIKQAGRVWSVPVIDTIALCGLYPILDSIAQFFHDSKTDRLHPNAQGHKRIAKTLFYQLLSLPCDF